jgi:hypothetical protein
MTFWKVLLLIGVALLVMVANVACSVLYMVIYGNFIDPGHDQQYYNDHVQVAAPYCSIVAGIPLMLFAGWWVSGWWQRSSGSRPAWIVWLAYALIDLTIIALAASLTLWDGLIVAISILTKLGAVLVGARLRLARNLQ